MIVNELFSWPALVAILAMTAMTYLMRTGGFWLMAHVPITLRVRRMLEALPGAVIVAIVLPIVMKAGVAAVIGVGVAVASMLARRNEFLALAAGVGTVALARAFGL